MSIQRDEFAVGINYDNKEYTVQDASRYIENTSEEGFANQEKLDELKRTSLQRARDLIKQYDLRMNRS